MTHRVHTCTCRATLTLEPCLLRYSEVEAAALHFDGALRLSALTVLAVDVRCTSIPAPHEAALFMQVSGDTRDNVI